MQLMNILKNDKPGLWLLAILLLISILVPMFNLLVPESSSLHLSIYTVTC